MGNICINFRSKEWVKSGFMRLCKDDNTNVSSALNQFMRQKLKDAGVTPPAKTKTATPATTSSDWRDDLLGEY
jgi:hypothetical protein